MGEKENQSQPIILFNIKFICSPPCFFSLSSSFLSFLQTKHAIKGKLNWVIIIGNRNNNPNKCAYNNITRGHAIYQKNCALVLFFNDICLTWLLGRYSVRTFKSRGGASDTMLKKAAVPYVKWNFLFGRDGYEIDGDGTIAV